jgi:hypothetical protein
MPELTNYEKNVVEEISDWLSSRPSLPGVVVKKLTGPFAHLTQKVVPRKILLKSIHKAEEIALNSADLNRVLEKAGASSVQELKDRPLEFSDQLADKYSIQAERAAMIDGVVAGLGGTATEIVNLPILVGAALRTITMIGHCYGYKLSGEYSQNYILLILNLSTVDEPERRQKLFHILRLMAHRHGDAKHDATMPVSHISEAMIEDVEISLIEQITMESIPIAGDLISMILDYDFMHHVDVTAKNVFRERRLRESGKTFGVRPSTDSRRRSALKETIEASGQIAYILSYGMAFAGLFPVYYSASLVKRIRRRLCSKIQESPTRITSEIPLNA